jgi:hypothetical protein
VVSSHIFLAEIFFFDPNYLVNIFTIIAKARLFQQPKAFAIIQLKTMQFKAIKTITRKKVVVPSLTSLKRHQNVCIFFRDGNEKLGLFLSTIDSCNSFVILLYCLWQNNHTVTFPHLDAILQQFLSYKIREHQLNIK